MARSVRLSPERSRFAVTVLVGIAIAYSPTYLPRALRVLGFDGVPSDPRSVILWNWLAVVTLFAYVYGVEERDRTSILVEQPSVRDLLWAVVFGLVGIALQIIASVALAPPSRGSDELLALSVPAIVALIATTAITEEVLFRGYVIERLSELTGRFWLAVAASAIVFAIPHVTFFGPLWLATNGGSVALLYVLYVWRRNLVACMMMHLVGNSLLLVPALGFA